MDYVIAALNGFRSDYYVPGTMDCAYTTKYTQIEFMRMYTYLTTLKSNDETTTFNITGTISGSFPDAIYKCYSIPGKGESSFRTHY